LVREVDGARHLLEDRDLLLERARRRALEETRERGSLDELHREEEPALGAAGVEDADDPRVVELAPDGDLALEAAHELVRRISLVEEDLERDLARVAFLARAVDHAHA